VNYVSVQSCPLRMFVCHGSHVFAILFAFPCARKVIFLSCHVLERFDNAAVVPLCAVACFLQTMGTSVV